MKTRTKALVVVEIAIVLCSVFLVALPAISADQTTQKVSACTSEVTTASEDDFTLEIYGNANEDDTIDMRDTTYIKLAIFGKKPKTDLADANYDGKVSMLDVGQTKLIILSKEKELTVKDTLERIVTVKMPVERLIPLDYRIAVPMLAIGAKDMIVAVDRAFHERLNAIDSAVGMTELPVVNAHGGPAGIDYEMVLTLKPDLVITWSTEADDIAEKLPSIPVVVLPCVRRSTIVPDLKAVGMILDKEEEAGELIDWIQKYDGMIEERTKDMKPDEMPTLYIEGWKRWWADTSIGNVGYIAEGCGGRNIAAELPGSSVTVDPEWVIEQSPEVMIHGLMHGHESGPGKTAADLEIKLEEVLADRPGFEEVNAVKNHRVYLLDWDLIYGPRYVVGRCYIAKWLHPKLFEDINPEELHNEYLSEFLGIELEGTWAYPLPE